MPVFGQPSPNWGLLPPPGSSAAGMQGIDPVTGQPIDTSSPGSWLGTPLAAIIAQLRSGAGIVPGGSAGNILGGLGGGAALNAPIAPSLSPTGGPTFSFPTQPSNIPPPPVAGGQPLEIPPVSPPVAPPTVAPHWSQLPVGTIGAQPPIGGLPGQLGAGEIVNALGGPTAPPKAGVGVTPALPQVPKSARVSPVGPGGGTMSIPMGQRPSFESKILSPTGPEGYGQNPRSSAYGPGQAIDSTFIDFLKANHPELANTPKGAALNALKDQYGTEFVPWYKGQVATAHAGNNIPVNDSTLYGGYLLGPSGFAKLWKAPDNMPVAQVLDPAAIKANPEVLSGKTVGEVKQWLDNTMSVLPKPPMMGAPPQQAQPGLTDFSKVRELLAQGNVSPGEHMMNVLGGLAGGAATVKANEPGSFAATLAAAGAGGAKGAAASYAASREAALKQAAAEVPLLTAEHQQLREQTDIAFMNAKNVYEVQTKNQLTQYEHALKERDILMPTVKSDANGITVQQFNPATNSMELKYIPTKPIFEQLEPLTNLIKAFGGNTPIAQAAAVNLIHKMFPGSPQIMEPMMRQMAVREAVQAGGGPGVFGPSYDAAVKAATKQIQAEAPSLAGKPEDYAKAVEERVIGILLSNPTVMTDSAWLKRAAPHSTTARILSTPAEGDQPPPPQPQNFMLGDMPRM